MAVTKAVVKRLNFSRGFTLVESLIVAGILVVASMGALSYQYHAARHGRIAKAQITATCTAQLLLEDWKSTGGSRNYDPSSLGLGFSSPLQIPSYWSEGQGIGLGTPLNNGVHSITIDGFPMLFLLKYRDVETDAEAKVTLRELTVVAEFGEADKFDPTDTSSISALANMPSIILVTYVRIDSTSG